MSYGIINKKHIELKKSASCILCIMLSCSFFSSCDYIDALKKSRNARQSAIVSIGDKHLYREDIEKIVPSGCNAEDSAKIVDGYIRRWAVDILTYENAKRNTKNQDDIEQLVKDYRRSLMIHYYKQNMVREKVKLPSDEETIRFYSENQAIFPLSEPAIKGIAISLPSNTSKLQTVKNKLQNYDKNLEFLEKFAMRNASEYSMFSNQWLTVKQLEENLNLQHLKIKGTGLFEFSDSASVTLIKITEFLPAGEPAPQELVMEQARIMLYGDKKVDYLQNFDREIYDYALRNGKIKFNNK